jgi:hypothetical protein
MLFQFTNLKLENHNNERWKMSWRISTNWSIDVGQKFTKFITKF